MLGQRKFKYDDSAGWIKQHSLGIVLLVIMFIQTIHALWAGRLAWLAEQRHRHGEHYSPGWSHEFWVWWGWEYNVSLVGDTFGVVLIVFLSKWFYEQGSAESTDE